MSKIKINKPPRKSKGNPPPENETTSNLDRPTTSEKENLNFKVPTEFKREFKAYCSENGVSMVWFLMEAYKRVKDEFRR